MRTFIFACVHNAGRSQMSAAFFNQMVNPALAKGISAGTHPADHVHPVVVDAMREVGIDLDSAKPQKLTAELAQNAEMLITMGCGDECPYVPRLIRYNWPLPDPKGQDIEAVRLTRDEIKLRVESLVGRMQLTSKYLATDAPVLSFSQEDRGYRICLWNARTSTRYSGPPHRRRRCLLSRRLRYQHDRE